MSAAISRKYFLCLVVVLFCFGSGFAQTNRKQDVIIKRDNVKIEALILEVDDQVIKYKKYSDQQGPVFIVNKKDVAKIAYGNGETEQFDAQSEIYFDETGIKKDSPVPPVQPINGLRAEPFKSLNSDQLRYNYAFYLKKSSRYRTMGIIGASVGILFTVVGLATVAEAERSYTSYSGGYYSTSSYENKLAGGALLVMTGLGAGIPLTIIGFVKKGKYSRKALATKNELKRRNQPLAFTLNPGFDVRNHAANLTLRYTF